MDYKNILEGTRPFFQGLPIIPIPSSVPSPSTLTPPGGGIITGTSSSSSSSSHHQSSQQQNNSLRMKYEEGLGATLSQMYNTGSPTLRIPASSSSPKTGPSPGGHNLSSPSPGRERGDPHLNLRGGSASSSSVNHLLQPSASPASSVLNIPSASSLVATSCVTGTPSGANNAPTPRAISSEAQGTSLPPVGIRRESPLDLSVKTVRQSADSSTNNPSEGPPMATSSHSQGTNNCVNSTGGSTRSLSSSGASTPNNSSTAGPTNVGNVIAALANSTTGGRNEREKDGSSNGSRPQNYTSQSNGQNTSSVSGSGTLHVTGPHPPGQQSQFAGVYNPQYHHLFGHHRPSSPGTMNIPTPSPSHSTDPGKLYQQHHYLQSQQSSYRPGNTSTPNSGSLGGFHSNPSHQNSTLSIVAASQPSSSSSNSTAPITSASSGSIQATTPNSNQSRSSVIPPYNPPQPTFGLGPYHHHSQPTGQIPSHHHPYHPYSSYHIQQPGPGPGHSSHSYSPYSVPPHYTASPSSQTSSIPPSPVGRLTSSNQSSASTSAQASEVRSPSYNHNQKVSSAPRVSSHENQSHQSTSPVSMYQTSTNAKATAPQQLYPNPHVPPQPPATVIPHHHQSQYPPYLNYYPSHPPPPTDAHGTTGSSYQSPRPQTPVTPQSKSTQFHTGTSYGSYSSAPHSYSSPYYQSPQISTKSPHPPSPQATPGQVQSHYYPYLNPAGPRPIPPPNSTNHQVPTNYPYPSHLAGPRPPAPISHPPQSATGGTYVPPSPVQSTPLNVPTPPKPTPRAKSPSKAGGKAEGSKTGEKRKNVLNLLRNSLETRIHEKQEKEKFQFNHQTWNFHGKKYHNPLPPPQAPGTVSSGGGGGSILTGLSNQSEPQSNLVPNGNSGGTNPGFFGMNQRSSGGLGEGHVTLGALSPNTENSLNRIRTKAEKKQVFPNLLSQIEQENASKHLSQQQSSGTFLSQTVGSNEKFKSHNYTTKASVFDFQDDEEDTKGNLSLMNRRSPIHNSIPALTPVATPVNPPKRRSGSKKFTTKLNKWTPHGTSSGLSGEQHPTSKLATPVTIQPGPTKSEISVVPLPSTSSSLVSATTEAEKPTIIDNMDEFWATCDSFLDDLSANPTMIKSRRGGLWAKLKSTSKEEKKRKGRRVRRPSAEMDADFELDEDAEEDGGEEEEKGDGNSESSSSSSIGDTDEISNGKIQTSLSSDSKVLKKNWDDEESDGDKKETQSESEKIRTSGKRMNPKSRPDSTPPPKKKKIGNSSDWGEEVKGRKVGKRLLRERRTGSLVGKGLSDLEDSLKSSGESENEDSDLSVASFTISSIDSGSDDSSDGSSSSTSEDSDDDSDSSGKSSGSESDNEELSLDESGKKVKEKRSNSTKGHIKTPLRLRTSKQPSRKNKKKKKSSGKGRRQDIEEGKGDSKPGNKRKLRPTRTCTKGKLKDISGESEEERGSSGEEWIMRGELGKRKKEKHRIVYGDGSDFRRPGWEEELIDFKKKLRMPTKLIQVAKPSSLSSTPTGGKNVADSTSSISPAKSAKENKSPSKVTVTEDDKIGKVKASSKKNLGADLQIEDTSPKGKKVGKLAKGRKPTTPKKGEDTVLTRTGGATPTGTPEKYPLKSKGKKGSPSEELKLDPPVVVRCREELLPTPGPAGMKFHKKMSIKSVFGMDVPIPASPSVPATPVASTPSPVPVKKVLRRNKFKSGFDYIRKKKKANLTPDGSVAPPLPKRTKISQEKNVTEDDVQIEMRGWVLNKGLGETVLHRAARLGYADVAAYALEHDSCSPNCKDNAGYSPLHETCIKGNLEVAKILLCYGANPSQAAPGGIRPLHEACENGHVELVRLLLSYGADPLLATYSGQAPIELAEHHKPVKRLLEQHIKDVQGKEGKLWEFRGTGTWAEEPFDSGYDVTIDPPPPAESPNIGEGFEFEASELPLPAIYTLKEDIPYILLQDLINFLGLPKDRILKTHPEAELVELNSNDFLEEVHCQQLLGVKFRLNLSSDLLTLIKYDDVIKKMLNIESCFIK